MKKIFVINVIAVAIACALMASDPIPQPQLTKDFPAPEPPCPLTLAAQPRTGTPKNIIFIIGDGMGQNAVRYAGLYAHGRSESLVMNQLPMHALAITNSVSGTTDSAASGTALSSGYKTINGMLGMNPNKEKFRSIAREAQSIGKAVGIITADGLVGATPAAFYAHVESRDLTDAIAEHALASDYEILIGNNAAHFLPKDKGGVRKDDRDVTAEFAAKGYQRVDTLDALKNTDGLPLLGLASRSYLLDDITRLAQYSTDAFARLAADPDGFFIMIEPPFADSGGHGNNPDYSIGGTLMTDFVVKAALDWALEHGDTLIVVTADHETGGLYFAPNTANPRRPLVGYTTKAHTPNPVDVFAFGPGSERFSGIIDNTDIPKTMADLWGVSLNNPVEE